MKKLVSILLLLLLVTALLSTGAFAADDRSLPRLVDGADLLTPSEEAQITGLIDAVLNKYNYDVVIVTCDSLEGKTATQYADDFYDTNGYGLGPNASGVLFLVSMRDRDWAVSTAGAAIHAFTDYGQRQMTDQVVPYLSSGDYVSAFDLFVQYADYYYGMYEQGTPVDIGSGEDYAPTGLTAGKVGIGGVIGFLIAFFTGGRMKAGMSSARTQRGAGSYVKQGSFALTGRNDVFTYSNVTRVPIATERSSGGGGSSTHISSSGVSHGGSSGKF